MKKIDQAQIGESHSSADSDRALREAYIESIRLRLLLALTLFIVIGILFVLVPHLPLLNRLPREIGTTVERIGGAFLAAALISVAARLFIIRHYDRFENRLQSFLRGKVTAALAELQNLVNERISSVETTVTTATKRLEQNIEDRTTRLIELASSLHALHVAGISKVYVKRSDAAEDMLADIKRPTTSFVEIAGISLNDFVRGESVVLHKVWEAIEDRIKEKVSLARPLKVRVLPVHPDCLGAALRSEAEHRQGVTMAGRLKKDVDATAEHLQSLETLAKSRNRSTNVEIGVSFKAKLCTVAPTLFLFRTDSGSYVQQYYFWSTRSSSHAPPTVRYVPTGPESDTSVHWEMGAHFDWLWEHASIPVFEYRSGHNTGHDKGLYRANCANVFNSTSAGCERIAWLLDVAQREVKVLGISLKSFFTGPFSDAISRLAAGNNLSSIQVLIIDPWGEAAKRRSFREFLLNPRNQELQLTYQQYIEQNKHIESDLMRDTEASLIKIYDRLLNLPKFQIRLYDCAPTCFLLLVDETALVEQYHFGKTMVGSEDGVQQILGKDMPLYEYKKSPLLLNENGSPIDLFPAESEAEKKDLPGRKPYDLIRNHFEHIWQYYSSPFDPTTHLRQRG